MALVTSSLTTSSVTNATSSSPQRASCSIAYCRAVATSAGLGVPITIAGTIGYVLAGLPQQALMPPLSVGFVSLIGFALMAPISSFTAPYGARLAHALSKRRLEIAFGSFLLLACLRFLVSLLG